MDQLAANTCLGERLAGHHARDGPASIDPAVVVNRLVLDQHADRVLPGYCYGG